MSGHGGAKHRAVARTQKRTQTKAKAVADIRRVRGLFEAKGQTFDPLNNPAQMAEMNHAARRLVQAQAKTRL